MPYEFAPMDTIDSTTRMLDHSHANGFGVQELYHDTLKATTALAVTLSMHCHILNRIMAPRLK